MVTKPKVKLCPKCGVNLEVEAEMFSHDKLYKKHSCGKEKI